MQTREHYYFVTRKLLNEIAKDYAKLNYLTLLLVGSPFGCPTTSPEADDQNVKVIEDLLINNEERQGDTKELVLEYVTNFDYAISSRESMLAWFNRQKLLGTTLNLNASYLFHKLKAKEQSQNYILETKEQWQDFFEGYKLTGFIDVRLSGNQIAGLNWNEWRNFIKFLITVSIKKLDVSRNNFYKLSAMRWIEFFEVTKK